VRRALALVLIALVLTPACSRQDEKRDELSDALYLTETRPRTFTYDERAAERTTVSGTIEDDYRYRVDATVGRTFAISQIVHDDVRAVRLDRNASNADLRVPAKRWVLDPHGANNLFTADTSGNPRRADDPVYDSLDLLRYVRRAMGEAAAIQAFNPESQDYRPKFDPFPRPGPDVKRYDVIAPALAPRDPTTASGRAQQLPGVRYFRRMSVYVEEGVVREVRESISVEDMLNDPRSRLAARIGDYGIELPEASTQRQAEAIVTAINGLAARLSQPGVHERELVVRIAYDDVADVGLPTNADRMKLAQLGSFPNDQLLYETPG
jgi:hypothetical protein